LLDINGALLQFAKVLRDDLTFIARLVPGIVNSLVARLEQFNYQALPGGVPGFHNLCVYMVPESWGYLLILYFGTPIWQLAVQFLSTLLFGLATVLFVVVLFARNLLAELTGAQVNEVEAAQERRRENQAVLERLREQTGLSAASQRATATNLRG
jgi:hypothetical protein